MPGIGKLFSGGGDRPKINTNFSSPGLRFKNNRLSLTGDTARLAGRREGLASEFRTLSGADFSGFRDSTLGALRNRQAQSTGDLRARLQRRRLAGSSFGEAELARKRVEDDQQLTAARERIGLAELDFRSQQLEKEAGVISRAISSAFQGAGIASNLIARVNAAQQAAFESDRRVLLDSVSGVAALGTRLFAGG